MKYFLETPDSNNITTSFTVRNDVTINIVEEVFPPYLVIKTPEMSYYMQDEDLKDFAKNLRKVIKKYKKGKANYKNI